MIAAADFCACHGSSIGWQTQARRSRAKTQAVQRGGGKQLFPPISLHQHHHRGHGVSIVCCPVESWAGSSEIGLQLCGVRVASSVCLVLQLGEPSVMLRMKHLK